MTLEHLFVYVIYIFLLPLLWRTCCVFFVYLRFNLFIVARYLDGKYITGKRLLFLELFEDDLEFFRKKTCSLVLVFPPFLSKFRWLAHKAVEENYPHLCSFSVGQNSYRRIVVVQASSFSKYPLLQCVDQSIQDLNEATKLSPCHCCEKIMYPVVPTLQFVNEQDNEADIMTKSTEKHLTKNAKSHKANLDEENNIGKCKSKRPDKALYIPRALRSMKKTTCLSENQSSSAHILMKSGSSQNSEMASLKYYNTEPLGSANEQTFDVTDCLNQICLKLNNTDFCKCVLGCRSCRVSGDKSIEPLMGYDSQNDHTVDPDLAFKENIGSLSDTSSDCDHKNVTKLKICKSNECDTSEIENELIYHKNDAKMEMNVTILKNVCDESSDDISVCSKETDSWDCMFNDQGECLNPDVVKELTDVVGNTEAHLAKNNYLEFSLPLEDSGMSENVQELSNVVELYGFPVQFNTQDLVSVFSCFKSENFTIKWVDDTHALAIFSTSFSASQALSLEHPFVKIRPVSQGIYESRLKAKRFAECLEPEKPRPATSATLARRLVSGALGLRVNIPKEQRERERKKILDAKAQRQEVAKQRRNVWDGIVS